MPCDGLRMTPDGNLYLTDGEHCAVSRFTPSGSVERVVTDHRLQWPDTLTQAPDGRIFVSASHINESANDNEGKPTRTQPYGLYALEP